MLTAFIRAFRTPDLRKKLLFTLGIIVLFRFGSSLPAPGISEKNVTYCAGVVAKSSSAGIYQIVYLLSGNALKYMSVFALGIMPYITASIILQLLTVVIPRLETLKQEGQAGQAKITQYTRYLTVLLAVVGSAGYVQLARTGSLFPGTDCSAVSHPIIPHPSVITLATMMITMSPLPIALSSIQSVTYLLHSPRDFANGETGVPPVCVFPSVMVMSRRITCARGPGNPAFYPQHR